MTVKSLRHPAGLIALWFGAGLSPKAPGTAGSVAALPFACIFWQLGGPLALLLATALFLPLALWAVSLHLQGTDNPDPGEIVADEVAGQWLTLAGLGPWAQSGLLLPGFMLGFVLFRLFDIWKPGLAGLADRKVKGAAGVMLDDLAAGLYAGIILYGAGAWISFHPN